MFRQAPACRRYGKAVRHRVAGSKVSKPFFGNWMVAIAEAAELAGAADLDSATADQMTKAWGLVRKAAEISLPDLTERIAKQAHISSADLANVDPHARILLPAEVARRRNVLPLRYTNRELTIATANPFSQEAKREVAAIGSREVTFEVAAPSTLANAVDDLYGALSDDERFASPVLPLETTQPKGPHVLVVDDEAGQRALFRSILEEGEFRVTVARDGPEALEVMRSDSSLDLVTLDYWMDKMNGLRVLQQIRSQPASARLPVIMVTGASDRHIEMSLFEAGADDFVVKPVDGPLFLLRIRAVLRRRGVA